MNYEATVSWLVQLREETDFWRLRVGLRVARAEKSYGSSVVKKLAIDSNMGRSTLYEYQRVWLFVWRWRQLSARRIFDDMPELTYTHLREAVRLPFEDAIDALLAVGYGDEDYDDYDLPMTPDAFSRYIAEKYGKERRDPTLFDEQGPGFEVFHSLRRAMDGLRTKRIRVVIKELE